MEVAWPRRANHGGATADCREDDGVQSNSGSEARQKRGQDVRKEMAEVAVSSIWEDRQ
jgi:hypothetical protein